MQSSIIRPNPPFPEDMAIILFCRLIKKLCSKINKAENDSEEMVAKIKQLKKMLDKSIITKEQYNKAIEMLLTEYIKRSPEKDEKDSLSGWLDTKSVTLNPRIHDKIL